MVFVFYNKLLLRVLTGLIGALASICAWHYIGLSAQKLGEAGVKDALAIVSFLIAGWLVMLIAEVADNHYVRSFGALCYLLGSLVSFKWIFMVDGPKLAEIQGGAQRLGFASLAFWLAVSLAVLLLLILVTRLILDKLSYGRPPEAVTAAVHSQLLSEQQPGHIEELRPAALPAIPLDQSPLGVQSAVAEPATPVRTPAPVRRLLGLSGPHQGQVFELRPGANSVGRENAAILLDADNQVSRGHAVLELGPDGIAVLRDSGSTNGSWVNGQRVKEMMLAPGDLLQLGSGQYRVEA